MKRLPITYRLSAMVDDEDYERCKNMRWYIKRIKRRRNGEAVWKTYVYTNVLVNGEPRHLHLARHVLNAPENLRVTYVNRDHLDCRKSNLKLSGVRQDLKRVKGFTHAELIGEILEELSE